MSVIRRAAIIGGGVIGAGWAARLIENGIDVAIYDPAQDAMEKVEAVLKNSRAAYDKLLSAPRSKEGSISFKISIETAVLGAGLIIESVPERLDVKQAVYAEIEQYAESDAIIASSTSGIGAACKFTDEEYEKAGAKVSADRAGSLESADLVLRFLTAIESEGADMACGTSGGRDQPVFGLWPVAMRTLGRGPEPKRLWAINWPSTTG